VEVEVMKDRRVDDTMEGRNAQWRVGKNEDDDDTAADDVVDVVCFSRRGKV